MPCVTAEPVQKSRNSLRMISRSCSKWPRCLLWLWHPRSGLCSSVFTIALFIVLDMVYSVNSQDLIRKSRSLLVDLLSFTANTFLSCGQVAELIRKLHRSVPGLRTEAVCCLFSRIVDLSNFHRVMWSLTLQERKEIIRRLGYLNM